MAKVIENNPIKEYGLKVGSKSSNSFFEVLNPYDQSVVAKVGLANDNVDSELVNNDATGEIAA